ncbi:hypothetical protein ASPZODRAFT_137372 [Penicilliopsis zonata CBS 506.65]|uniref:Uncharacterized protein n=1 Tax=Penicilliopsis zonata CBS 506.65 TaxID=1073090 RepID=A0A1L9S553_9EURO|nr:hypothetical protein ASPZODRAFT_137372 [Penicilliopsis zonata CBS 506.65]OJJ42286.1 hypothetical protein ASPZODRAFT_137372 [Penicilliopsis zonata CBS 506.65]
MGFPYTQLVHEDELERPKTKTHPGWIFGAGVFSGVIVSVILYALLNFSVLVVQPWVLSTPQSVSDEIQGTQCGSSWQEAKAMGCHYDVMASRWYSDECFDAEVLEEMLLEPQVNFTWYMDEQHTQEVPWELALSGEFEVLYPLYDFHKIHCLYLWRRLHHAVLNNRPLDDDLLEYEHTVHCTRNLLTWPDPHVQEGLTTAHAGIPFCRSNPLGVLPVSG